jgi:hypothetical protein
MKKARRKRGANLSQSLFEVLFAFTTVGICSVLICFTYFIVYPFEAPDEIRDFILSQRRGLRKSKQGFHIVRDSNPFSLYDKK